MTDLHRESLDNLFRTTRLGSISKAIGDNLYGINHTRQPAYLEYTKRNMGFTFFTRPQLNFQEENIQNAGIYYPLLSRHPASMQRYVRCMLDPRLIYGYNGYRITCPHLDNQLPFIPPATNNLKIVTGWPEKVMPMFVADDNDFGVGYSMVDGISDLLNVYDLDATFRSHYGDPLLRTFSYLMQYQSDVRSGILVPYPDTLAENRLDYTLGMYRFLFDRTGTYITDMVHVSKMIVQNDPTARLFDFNNEKVYTDQTEEFTIKFKVEGIYYNNPITVRNFNDLVTAFNPSMSNAERPNAMTKLTPDLANFFRNRGYPRIEPHTNELEWWIPNNLYSAVTDTLNSARTGSYLFEGGE